MLQAVADEMATAAAEPLLVLRNIRLTADQARRLASTLNDLVSGLGDAGDGAARYGVLACVTSDVSRARRSRCPVKTVRDKSGVRRGQAGPGTTSVVHRQKGWPAGSAYTRRCSPGSDAELGGPAAGPAPQPRPRPRRRSPGAPAWTRPGRPVRRDVARRGLEVDAAPRALDRGPVRVEVRDLPARDLRVVAASFPRRGSRARPSRA